MLVKVYHGTDQLLTELRADSWVTMDREVASDFALEAAKRGSGSPHVYEIDIEDLEVEWDIAAAVSGVEDMRGTIRRPIRVDRIASLSPGL